MSKTKEELDELKKKYEKLVKDLDELSKEELEAVTGGAVSSEEELGGRIYITPTEY